jgi:hypothetical protein
MCDEDNRTISSRLIWRYKLPACHVKPVLTRPRLLGSAVEVSVGRQCRAVASRTAICSSAPRQSLHGINRQPHELRCDRAAGLMGGRFSWASWASTAIRLHKHLGTEEDFADKRPVQVLLLVPVRQVALKIAGQTVGCLLQASEADILDGSLRRL